MSTYFDAIRSMGYQTNAGPIVVIYPPEQNFYPTNDMPSSRTSPTLDRQRHLDNKQVKQRRRRPTADEKVTFDQPMNLKLTNALDKKRRKVCNLN